jgi:hypothetical protein
VKPSNPVATGTLPSPTPTPTHLNNRAFTNDRSTVVVVFAVGTEQQAFWYHIDTTRVYVREDGIAFAAPAPFVAALTAVASGTSARQEGLTRQRARPDRVYSRPSLPSKAGAGTRD